MRHAPHPQAILVLFTATCPLLAAPLTQKDLQQWGQSEYLFVGKLDQALGGPVGLSNPPVYTHRLQMTVMESFRGPATPGQKLNGSHSARQQDPPTFPVGKKCLISANHARGRLSVVAVAEADQALLDKARLIRSVPLGWTMDNGQWRSPWAKEGAPPWPGKPAAKGTIQCSKTGRPAQLAGASIRFEVTAAPPAKKIKWTNPDGDGEYQITLTNTTKQPVTVSALLNDGKNILWRESLLILCQGKAYTIPGAKPLPKTVGPTTLQPGQSVSTKIHALALKGPQWPRGGYRIAFQFCLGEKSRSHSFYYMSRHHDKLRDAAQAKNP